VSQLLLLRLGTGDVGVLLDLLNPVRRVQAEKMLMVAALATRLLLRGNRAPHRLRLFLEGNAIN